MSKDDHPAPLSPNFMLEQLPVPEPVRAQGTPIPMAPTPAWSQDKAWEGVPHSPPWISSSALHSTWPPGLWARHV